MKGPRLVGRQKHVDENVREDVDDDVDDDNVAKSEDQPVAFIINNQLIIDYHVHVNPGTIKTTYMGNSNKLEFI